MIGRFEINKQANESLEQEQTQSCQKNHNGIKHNAW